MSKTIEVPAYWIESFLLANGSGGKSRIQTGTLCLPDPARPGVFRQVDWSIDLTVKMLEHDVVVKRNAMTDDDRKHLRCLLRDFRGFSQAQVPTVMRECGIASAEDWPAVPKDDLSGFADGVGKPIVEVDVIPQRGHNGRMPHESL